MANTVDRKQEALELKCQIPNPERALPLSVVIDMEGFKSLLDFRLDHVQTHIVLLFLIAPLCFKAPSGFLDCS